MKSKKGKRYSLCFDRKERKKKHNFVPFIPQSQKVNKWFRVIRNFIIWDGLFQFSTHAISFEYVKSVLFEKPNKRSEIVSFPGIFIIRATSGSMRTLGYLFIDNCFHVHVIHTKCISLIREWQAKINWRIWKMCSKCCQNQFKVNHSIQSQLLIEASESKLQNRSIRMCIIRK